VRRAAALVLVIAGALLAISQPGQIQAHAALRSSDPGANAFLQRAPARVTLTFTEPIDSRSSTIQVLDAQGSLVETATPAVSGVTMSVELPQIGPGIYNVLWGNVSRIDGHAIKAVVVPAEGAALTEEEVRRHCRARLETYMVPKLVEFCTSLPKTESGKIRRAVVG